MGGNKFIYLSMLLTVILAMAVMGISDGYRGAAVYTAAYDFCFSVQEDRYEVSSAFESIPRSSILNKCDSGSGAMQKGNSKSLKSQKKTVAVSMLAMADARRHIVEHNFHYPLCVGYDVHCIDFFSRMNV